MTPSYSQQQELIELARTAMRERGLWPDFSGKRIKWLILPLHESEANRHLSGLSGWHSNLLLMHASLANSSKNPTRLNFPVIVATRS